MKVFYDKGMIFEKINDKYLIYNPSRNSMVRVNNLTKIFITKIMDNNGIIDEDNIIKFFYENINININNQIIKDLIKHLIDNKIFFIDGTYNDNTNCTYENNDIKLAVAYLHPTLRCNFNCSYCYNKNINKNLDELDTKSWINIINKLKVKNVKNFIFTGGEVLLRRDLEEIIQSTKDEKTHFQIITNGSLLKDRVTNLVPLLDKVNLSLDSFDLEITKENRDSQGFDDILFLLDWFKNFNKDKLTIKSVITKKNEKEIFMFKKLIEQNYGFKVNLSIFIPNSQDDLSKMPNIDFKQMEDYMIDDGNITSKKLNVYSNKCGACRKIIAINPCGDIYPCQSLLNEKFKMTNILKDNWYEELNGSEIKMKFGSLTVDNKHKCQDCNIRYLCGGGCPAVSYKVYGDMNECFYSFCEYYKNFAHGSLKILGS